MFDVSRLMHFLYSINTVFDYTLFVDDRVVYRLCFGIMSAYNQYLLLPTTLSPKERPQNFGTSNADNESKKTNSKIPAYFIIKKHKFIVDKYLQKVR